MIPLIFDLLGDEDVGEVGNTYCLVGRCLSESDRWRCGWWCSRSELVDSREDRNGTVLTGIGPKCLYLFARNVFPPGCVWRTWYDESEVGGKRWVFSSQLVELSLKRG